MISESDLARYHAAAKMIEYDSVECYHTCCSKYGTEITNFLLIANLRSQLGAGDQYPTKDGVIENVNSILKNNGLLTA